MTVISFPSSGLHVQAAIDRAKKMRYLWAGACGVQLDKRIGWAFPDGIPGNIGDAWFEFASIYSRDDWSYNSSEVDWDITFKAFADRWLVYQLDFRLIVETLQEETDDPTEEGPHRWA